MPARRLIDLARRCCIRNIRDLETVGDLPYDVVRPILLRLDNPQQLANIEENSPQIRGPDAEVWERFMERDLDHWKPDMVHSENPENFGELYFKLFAQTELDRQQDMKILELQLRQKDIEKESHKSTQVDPRSLPKVKAYGGGSHYNIIRERQAAERSERNRPGSLALKIGSKTKMVTGKHIMEKARREASQASVFKKNNAFLPPQRLSGKSVEPGPTSHQQPSVSQRRNVPSSSTSHRSVKSAFGEREQRLRDIIAGNKLPAEQSNTLPATLQPFDSAERPRSASSSLLSRKRKFESFDSDSAPQPSPAASKPDRPRNSPMLQKESSLRPETLARPKTYPRRTPPQASNALMSPPSEPQSPDASENINDLFSEPSRSPSPVRSCNSSVTPSGLKKSVSKPPAMVLPRKKKTVDIFVRPRR